MIYPILKKNDNFNVVGFTSRTKETRENFSKESGLKSFEDSESLADNCDALIVCVAPSAAAEVNRKLLQLNIPLLIETPVMDVDFVKKAVSQNLVVGTLEQWPSLPIEQFKKNYIKNNVKTPIYLVMNDCRSFAYHAIAQMRSYIGRGKQPVKVKSQNLGRKIGSSIKANNGEIKTDLIDMWDLGIVQFEDAVLLHNFSYMCKTAPYRPLHTLRCYSEDATIISGRMKSSGNDYEILEFAKSENNESIFSNLSVTREGEVTKRIEDSTTETIWENPYADFDFDDQKTAIMTTIEGFRNHLITKDPNEHGFYSAYDSYIDCLIMNAIQHAAQTDQTVSFQG
jgi:predicted dehydrogenase